jgi:hypothetical protein
MFPLPEKRKKLGRMGEKEEISSNSPIPQKKPARKGKVAHSGVD